MLLVTFSDGADARIGVLDREAGEVVDLAKAAPELAGTMLGLIRLGSGGLAAARRAVASGAGRLPLGGVRLLAPIPRPGRNLLCIGKNYRDHAAEIRAIGSGGSDEDLPRHPIVFTKAPATVIGPGEPIPAYLDRTESVDYEGELAVVIGPGGRDIPRSAAREHIFGYTIVNDVTSRRLQRRHGQWFIGKSLDGFCPMGPAILSADEVPDAGALRVQTRVNGELRQDGRTVDLIFDIPTLIETLSTGMTLEAGDLIATGTPAGVGVALDPPRFLRPGDRVAITVEPIGTLDNPVA